MTDSASHEPKELRTRKPKGLRRTARILSMLLRIIPKILVAGRFFKAEVVNRHMLKYDGRLLVVANHRSKWDPVYEWVAQGKPTMFVAKAELWSIPVVGWIMRVLGHVPVKRNDPTSRRNVLVFGQEILENDGRLIIFFEGTTHQLPYNAQTNIGKTYDGAAMLALRTNTPVLACGLRGTSEVGNVFTALFRRPEVRSNYAPQYVYPQQFLREIGLPKGVEPTEKELRQAAARMTEELEIIISGLIRSI